jgi:putative endonuclease
LAAAWYRDRGYTVLARNWRTRLGELDLVVAHGRSLVFCEVKARTTDAFGTPAEAVNREKRARIRRLAAQWIASEAVLRPREIRFDVVAVSGPAGAGAGVVEVIEGAF